MNMLFIASTYRGGIGGHALQLSQQLQKRGHYTELLKAPHIPIKNFKNPSFAVLAALRTLLTKKRYDVVHAFNLPAGLPMRYTNAKKKILSMHGVYSDQITMLHPHVSYLARPAETKVFSWADTVTTDSRYTAASYGNRQIKVLPTPIDPTQFRGLENTKKEAGQITYVGRDSYEKGIDVLRKIEPNVHGTIHYCTNLPWRDAMSVLAKSTVMVLPSRIESLPTVIKEAFYLKVPVVATPVGGIPELIQDGKTGFLVEDPVHMTQTINDIIHGVLNTEKIVDAAYKFVTQEMTWDTVIPKYEKMYLED